MNDPGYESYTREHYRDPAVAERYASRLERSWSERAIGRLERRGVEHGLRALDAERVGVVVDVPAGTGKLTGWLTERSTTYVALDVSEEMLSRLSGTRMRARADATRLPLADASADVVVMLRLLHRVPREVARAMLTEALRVSRVGVVASYAGTPAVAPVHTLLQRVSGRGGTRTVPLRVDEFAGIASGCGGHVVLDQSISARLTAERVAAVRRVAK